MKPTHVQRILAVMMSVLLLITVFPTAVFAAGETETGDYYEKITDVTQMEDDGQYLIVCESEYLAFDGSLGEDMDCANNNIEVDFQGNRIAATEELDAASFFINFDNGTIRSASGWYIGCTGSKNSLVVSETPDIELDMTFEFGEDFVASLESDSGVYRLQFNPLSGQKRFRFFKSGQDPVQLYMRIKPQPVELWNGEVPAAQPAGFTASGDIYTIESADALIWFLHTVAAGSTYAGKTVNLAIDPNLDEQDFLDDVWAANSTGSFCGTFDGQGHTITGFVMTSGGSNVGLFRAIGEGAAIRNLHLADVSVEGTGDNHRASAALAGYAQGNVTIEDVHLDSGEVFGYDFVGGLLGESTATLTMTNCSNAASIYGENDRCGGLVGSATGVSVFTDCINSGFVEGDRTVGGLLGYTNTTATFTGSVNTGEINATGPVTGADAAANMLGNVGGLLGYGTNATHTFTNCYNTGTIRGDGHVGGLYGFARYSGVRAVMDRCWNAGTITSYSIGTSFNNNSGSVDFKGGLLGFSEEPGSSITNCFNWGSISTRRMAAGIFGGTGSNNGSGAASTLTIKNCYNAGNLHANWIYTMGWGYGNSGGVYQNNYYSSDSVFESQGTSDNGQRLQGTAKTDEALCAYADYSLSKYFVRNNAGVTVNGVAYYYPVLVQGDTVPFDASATMWVTDTDSQSYRTGIFYTIRNLTTGSSMNSTGLSASQYFTNNSVFRKTYQDANGAGVTGSSVGTLVIDRAKYDTVEQTDICVEYYPFIYSAAGAVRWGVELFPYSDTFPSGLGALSGQAGVASEYNQRTVTGTKGNDYTYALHFGSADGQLRCAETSGGDFTTDAACTAGTDMTFGPYDWYITGDAPAVGESVTLRVVAICCARVNAENLQMLSEWTDITITGVCSHGDGHLHAVAANAPTCTQPGNSAYWQCDVCGKYYSDAEATQEIDENSWILPAINHHYVEPAAEDWSWTRSGDAYTATVTVACERGDDTQTLTAEVDKTAAADGTAIYTATATVGEQTFTATKPTVFHSVTGYNDANGNTVTADPATAAEGQTVTLTVTPADGYGLKSMTISNGGVITAGANNTFTFIMPDEDVAVDAVFALEYSVAVVTDGHGTVAADKPNAFAGDTVTLTVTPNTNYVLDTLTVTDGNGDPVTVADNTFIMPASAVTVTANFYEIFQIWVGSVQVTEKNMANVLGDGTVAYAGSQTAGTLTLTNANITEKTTHFNSENLYVYNSDLSLTIMLVGENKVGDDTVDYSIHPTCHDLTITGSGSLDVKAKYEGIYTSGCPVLIDSTTLSVDAAYSFGMEINSNRLTIRNSSVTSAGNNMAIDASFLDIDNCIIHAYARDYSYALYGAQGIRINNSTVVADAAHHFGISSGYGDLTITNSEVTASSGRDTGINVHGNCTITDSMIETTGYYQGIYVTNGSLIINGTSELVVHGRNAGFAAVIADQIVLDDGISIVTPENSVVNDYFGKFAVYESDGSTLADYVVIRSALREIFVGAHSLSLNGDIGVNFYAYIPDVTDTAYAEFTVNGETVTVPIDLNKFAVKNGLTLYKFSCDVAAAQIDTEITGVIHHGEKASDGFTYTVQDYLTEAQTTMADDAKFMALAGSLATYGYYANELFAFDPDFTQHALFDDSGFASVTAASLADDEAQITNTADGVTYVGSSLVLRTETTIKHYFTLPADASLDDYTFLLGEGDTAIEMTPQANGSFYYVEIPDIGSGNLGKAYTVTVLDGDGNAVNTWTYSAMSYVYKVLTKAEANDLAASTELVNVSKALALYYQAADAYFHRETV